MDKTGARSSKSSGKMLSVNDFRAEPKFLDDQFRLRSVRQCIQMFFWTPESYRTTPCRKPLICAGPEYPASSLIAWTQ